MTETELPAWVQLQMQRVEEADYKSCRNSLMDLYLSKRIDFYDVLNFCVACELAGAGKGVSVLEELEKVYFPNYEDLELDFKRCVNEFKDSLDG